MDFQIFYKILDIPDTAGIEQLKRAYREKVKIYHPDVSSLPNAQELFIALTEAYEILLRKLSVEKQSRDSQHETRSKDEWTEFQNAWLREQMIRIRKSAYAQSKMKFDEFKKTPTYRATQTLSKIADYIMFFLGFMIIFGAFVGIHEQYVRGRMEAVNVVGVFCVVIIGLTIILYSLYKFRK